MTLACLFLGAALLLVGVPSPRRVPPPLGSLPLALDLIAVALHAGQSVAGALDVAAAAAPADEADRLRNVAVLLRLGADPPEAWEAIAGASPQFAELRRIAGRSSVSGARLADAFSRYAVRMRTTAAAADESRAHRAGVLCAAPLALCFLPSFVCLGIIPTLVGLARGALHTVT